VTTEMAAGTVAETKGEILALASRHICPDRVRVFAGMGLDLVIGRREGYRIWDMDGHELLDVHLNGGTYNVGHRHPEVVAALTEGLQTLDIGNHHFPSPLRARLGAELSATTGGRLPWVVLTSSGSEAMDVAIKSARHATGRRKIVAIEGGYHGRTGFSGAAGDDATATFFLSDLPDDFVKVPFGDLGAMRAALAAGDVAAVAMETIPATLGFPIPAEGYLPAVRTLCTEFGTLYIADEVQTGLGRTRNLWAFDTFGVEPDIFITGKGLSGGLYPIAAAVLSDRAGAWLDQDGWGHVSTFGGAELGCVAALKTLEIIQRPETAANAASTAAFLGDGLTELQARVDQLIEVRQCGLVFGLKFDTPDGGVRMSKALYDNGVWGMFAGFDRSVLQFKPGLLLPADDATTLLTRLETTLIAI
jgi:putrescine aminotransferase